MIVKVMNQLIGENLNNMEKQTMENFLVLYDILEELRISYNTYTKLIGKKPHVDDISKFIIDNNLDIPLKAFNYQEKILNFINPKTVGIKYCLETENWLIALVIYCTTIEYFESTIYEFFYDKDGSENETN